MKLVDMLANKKVSKFSAGTRDTGITIAGSDEFRSNMREALSILRQLPEAYAYALGFVKRIEETQGGQPRILNGIFYVPSNSYTANNPLYAALALAHEAKHMDKELAQTEPRWREADAVNAQLAVAYGLLGLSSLTDEQKDQLRFYTMRRKTTPFQWQWI